ncbi:MAG: CTP synthase [Clostridiales bacterium]|nr:CTP synthase [Clostridiales bacterium]
MAKFIFVTGGVVSGLGKGVTAASLARLIKARGYRVTLQKFDPYFNTDTSNISPYQHGEVYVTEDGGEVDLVMGHYERLLGENLGIRNDVTSGQIYSSVIAKEREGYYKGSTVQVVPHITNEIKERIYSLATPESDVVITEIGGTVGDIECHPFLEAIRQFKSEAGKGNVLYVHVTLVPYIEMSGEQKTKPTQHSVKELQNVGIQPDIIVCRSDYPIGADSKRKLALFCNVESDCIIQNLTTDNICNIPLLLEDEGLARAAVRKLKLQERTPDLEGWRDFCRRFAAVRESNEKLRIGIVGKYTDCHDAYVSLTAALDHSGVAIGRGVEIVWISAERAASASARMQELHGLVIPAGFGERGFEGKIAAARYARENNIPVCMIGMGAHAGLVEFARTHGMEKANSTEFDRKTPYPVVYAPCVPPRFYKGAYASKVQEGSKLYAIYGKGEIGERHRHKYEFNPAYTQELERAGLVFSVRSASGNVCEAFELPAHPFYVGVTYHPEFTSRPDAPHPLITAFLTACATDACH